MQDTTLEDDNSLVPLECPFTGKTWGYSTKQEERQREEQRERVRQVCVAEYSSNPLWQARARNNPEYWNNFYVGRINL